MEIEAVADDVQARRYSHESLARGADRARSAASVLLRLTRRQYRPTSLADALSHVARKVRPERFRCVLMRWRLSLLRPVYRRRSTPRLGLCGLLLQQSAHAFERKGVVVELHGMDRTAQLIGDPDDLGAIRDGHARAEVDSIDAI